MKNLFYFFSLNLRKVMKEIGNLFCSLEDVFAHFLDKKKKITFCYQKPIVSCLFYFND